MNCLIVIVAILMVCLVYFVVAYNKLIKLNNSVSESFATMDVYLKKRWDLIPNLVEIVKGYAKHEKETFEEIAKLRSENYESLSADDKIKTNEQLNRDVVRIMALAEAYPELKSNESFLQLSGNLTLAEDEIAQSRKYYNAVVRDYNNKVEMIPSNIVAKVLGYKSKLMFAANVEERENVKVKL